MSQGLNIGQTFNSMFDSVNNMGASLQKQMNDMSSKGEINQTDLLKMQFAMGQYNAMIETLSSVTKSVTDSLKSLAQRTG